jgi:hypothetical protein
MSEKKLVIDQLKLTYSGLFDLNGLYRIMDEWFYEKNYDRWELKNYEFVLPEGKVVEIELLPWKKTTEYFKNTIRIRLKCSQIKDAEVEKEGVKIKVSKGDVQMVIDGYLETDYENWWDERPMLYFIRTIFDKYIFKRQFSQYEKWLVNDVYDLYGRLQKFLNLYRYEKHV